MTTKVKAEIDRQDIWQHKQTGKCYEVLEVKDQEARCIELDTKLVTFIKTSQLKRVQIGFNFVDKRPEPRYKKGTRIPP